MSCFCGNGKSPVDDFLKPFVDEVLLHDNVIVKKIVCDTPARAMTKCIKNHTGYSSCDKCDVTGEYDADAKQVIFTSEGSPRTNDDFRAQTDMRHHKGVSPILRQPIDMVNSLPYDPMHFCIFA